MNADARRLRLQPADLRASTAGGGAHAVLEEVEQEKSPCERAGSYSRYSRIVRAKNIVTNVVTTRPEPGDERMQL